MENGRELFELLKNFLELIILNLLVLSNINFDYIKR